MRLGQLSRKTDTKPTEILSYLKNEFDVELGSHLNTKVDDELTKKVISKFAKPKTIEVSPVKPKTEVDTSSVKEENLSEPSAVVEDKESVENTEDTSPTATVNESDIEKPSEFKSDEEVDALTILNAELIKAPKVELPGPKVVGKIDLPPTLEEQMVEVDGVMMSKAELANRKKEERLARREKSGKGRKRSVKQVGASRIKSEAQIEQIKKDKEAELMNIRIANREKRITQKKKESAKQKSTFVPKKPKKPTKQAVAKAVEIQKEKVAKPKPSTWYGKLWLWFNT